MPDQTLAEAQRLVREIAEAEDAGNTKGAIARAAESIGITFRRCFGLYYGQARSIQANEWIAVTEAAMASRRRRAARLRAELEAIEHLIGDDNADHLAHQRGSMGMGRRQGLRHC